VEEIEEAREAELGEGEEEIDEGAGLPTGEICDAEGPLERVKTSLTLR
jgi:hypothetical protein